MGRRAKSGTLYSDPDFVELSTAEYYERKPSRIWVRQIRRVKATFSTKMNIHYFPFDQQLLTMTITSQLPIHDVLLRFCDRDRCANMMSETTHLQEFEICAPRLIAYDQPGALSASLPLLSKPNWSRTGLQYSWIHIAPVVNRHASPHLRNILIPQSILASIAFATFFFPPDDLGNRLNVDINLFLATITLRLIVADQIPKVAYLTWLGGYCLNSLHFLGFVVLENVCASAFGITSKQERPVALCLAFLWVLLNAHYARRIFCYVRWRRNYSSTTHSLFHDFNFRDNIPLHQNLEKVDVRTLETKILACCTGTERKSHRD